MIKILEDGVGINTRDISEVKEWKHSTRMIHETRISMAHGDTHIILHKVMTFDEVCTYLNSDTVRLDHYLSETKPDYKDNKDCETKDCKGRVTITTDSLICESCSEMLSFKMKLEAINRADGLSQRFRHPESRDCATEGCAGGVSLLSDGDYCNECIEEQNDPS